MKNNLILAVGGIGLLLAGCSTSHNTITLGAVGPGPASSLGTVSTQGRLLVYSAYEVNADFNSRDSRRPEYSDYRVLTTDGKLQQKRP